MLEEWKPVKEFEGLYEVSNLGRVRALSKRGFERGGILKQRKNTGGYMELRLSKNNQKFNVLVHRLVAMSFIPNPDNKPCINHIDGNKQNNVVENLEWCTHKENAQHALKHGLFDVKTMRDVACKKRAVYGHPNDVSVIRSDGVVFQTIAEAAKSVGVDRSVISRVANHKNGKRTAGGYGWELINKI